ncbi:MAG: nitroreductase family protein [Oscillospiraceae bacterium]
MDAWEALLTRRSIRKYKPDPVPEDLLRELLEAACAAPSAINQQHWHFVALRSPEALADLREIMGRTAERFHPVLEQRFSRNPGTIAETETFLTTLGGAPVCVLAFFLRPDYPDRDGAMQSVSAALENLLLAARAKDLGSCWLSAPQRMGFGGELRDRFAPGKGEFVAAVTLGWPDQSPSMPPRREGRYTIL